MGRMRKTIWIFLTAAFVGVSGCQNAARATTMHLVRTEGTVGVTDGDQKDVALIDQLGLYSGYQVGTRAQSYAWIDLDDVKLTKMDADSQVEIQKTGNDLEILVNSGSLFFNVTKPLEADETMTIRTSNMMVGIRGTCGWVEVEDPDHMKVFLLEGSVSCVVADPGSGQEVTETVNAGETGLLTAWSGEEEGSIQVEKLPYTSVPDFVLEELENPTTQEGRDFSLFDFIPEWEMEDSVTQDMRDKAEEESEAARIAEEEAARIAEEEQKKQEDDNRRLALLNELLAAQADGRAMYVLQADMNRDGLDDLLFFGAHRFSAYGIGRTDWGFTACLWDGQQTQLVDLTNVPRDYLNIFGANSYGVYRERATGDIYVRYDFSMDSVVECTFMSVDDMVDMGYDYQYETEEGMADGAMKRQQRDDQIDQRFELIETMTFSENPYDNGYFWSMYWDGNGQRPEDPPFASTLDQVEQDLAPEGISFGP